MRVGVSVGACARTRYPFDTRHLRHSGGVGGWGQVMRDPVVAADGHTYERAGVEEWFAAHGAVSMVTGASLPHTRLVPNQASLPPLPRISPPIR
jgi:hypothetical protein